MKWKTMIIAFVLSLSMNITCVFAKSQITADNLYLCEEATLTITDIKKNDSVTIRIGSMTHKKKFSKKKPQYTYTSKLPGKPVKIKIVHYNAKKKVVAQKTFEVRSTKKKVFNGSYVFITTKSNRFHRDNCVCMRFAHKMKITKSEAIKKGYKRCQICKPQ